MEYLAHISDDKTRKQTVLEHSQNVAMLAKQYAMYLKLEVGDIVVERHMILASIQMNFRKD